MVTQRRRIHHDDRSNGSAAAEISSGYLIIGKWPEGLKRNSEPEQLFADILTGEETH